MTAGLVPVLGALVIRPRLWPTAASRLLVTARPGWWRHWPPLPLPSPAWLAFRLECATGEPDGAVSAADVVAWLEWCRELTGQRANLGVDVAPTT